MKILGKNVYIGNICICTEYTSQLIGDFRDIHVGEKSHKGQILEENILFIKDANGLYVDARDTEGIGSLAIKMYGGARRYKRTPHEAGDQYITVKHYFNEAQSSVEYPLKELLLIAKSLKSSNNEFSL